MALALQLGDLELEVRNHRLIIRRLGARSGGIGDCHITLCADNIESGVRGEKRRLQRVDIIRKGGSLSFHDPMESQNRSLEAPLNASSQKFIAEGVVQPAACGRQVRCGMRQSIPSRR